MVTLRFLWALLATIFKVSWWLVLRLADLVTLIVRAARTDFRSQGALGTARWATGWELFRAGVYRGAGPVVGKGSWGRLMRFNTDGVVQVFASTGSGKGLGVVIPTLLDYPGSMVVTDVKGENFAITARARAKRGKVVMLNPSNLTASDRFNPLDLIRKGTAEEADDARMLADLMILRDSADGHWSDKSTSVLAMLILHAVHDPNPDNRTLAHVRKLSVGTPEVMRERLADIARDAAASLASSIAMGFQGTIGNDGGQHPEFASILSDLHKATEPWTEGTPAGRLSSHSTFSLEELNGQDTVTIFLCVDEEKLRTYRRWLRVMAGLTMAAIMRGKYAARPKHKPLLLLDEVRMLGYLDVLAESAGLLRAYCTPVLIWQNMPQVRSVYGQGADAFLANASCRVFFGIADNDTAHQVSQICGQTQVEVRSAGTSQASDAWLRENRSQGESEGGYWLIDPSEVQRLGVDEVIVKMRHVKYPIFTRRLDYRHVIRWAGRWDHWAGNTPPKKAKTRPPAPPSDPMPRREVILKAPPMPPRGAFAPGEGPPAP